MMRVMFGWADEDQRERENKLSEERIHMEYKRNEAENQPTFCLI